MDAWIVDTFMSRRCRGNPAAVVEHDGSLARATMQAAAQALGQPATAFIRRLDVRSVAVRWFTPSQEIELCGHATVASACYLHSVVGISTSSELRFVSAGEPLHTKMQSGVISISLPLISAVPGEPTHHLEGAIGAQIVRLATAGRDLIMELASEDAVRDVRPDLARLRPVDCDGHIVTAASDRRGVDFVSRSFLPALGVDEDQVCVSAHSWLGPYWAPRLGRRRLIAEQLSSRGGRLALDVGRCRVSVAGAARVRERVVA